MSECRRLTNPILAPHAVTVTPRSCLQMLASGYINPPDLCPACTQTFMQALDAKVPGLEWHPNYRVRAGEGVPR